MALSDLRVWGRRRAAPLPTTVAGAQPIGAAPRRGRVRVTGDVTAVTPTGHAGIRALEVTVEDGTGTARAVFTGRDEISGITMGRTLLLEGMARREGGALVLRNPSYRLLD